mmetsp:Transcript_121808/g.316140  ORF Transcript_121808/g.316140 Transcript_121808/m.316140 type:complete len:223 (-) Transcript_121808:206-874(-)
MLLLVQLRGAARRQLGSDRVPHEAHGPAGVEVAHGLLHPGCAHLRHRHLVAQVTSPHRGGVDGHITRPPQPVAPAVEPELLLGVAHAGLVGELVPIKEAHVPTSPQPIFGQVDAALLLVTLFVALLAFASRAQALPAHRREALTSLREPGAGARPAVEEDNGVLRRVVELRIPPLRGVCVAVVPLDPAGGVRELDLLLGLRLFELPLRAEPVDAPIQLRGPP